MTSSKPENTHRVRAFADLAQLQDPTFFAAIAEGLAAIHENAARLAEGMRQTLEAGNGRAARILEALANEESGKYLILLDATRCPRERSGLLAGHLRKAGDHLAKGIYAEACLWRTIGYRDVAEHVDRARPEYYLDGPTGSDWIFRNWIMALREEMFYVDYVAGSDGHRAWWSPERFDASGATFIDATAFRVVDAMHALGFSRPESLTTIASIWRSVPVDESLDWRTVANLNADTLARLDANYGDAAALVGERWPYPMYRLEMSPLKLKQSELREIQARSQWSSEG